MRFTHCILESSITVDLEITYVVFLRLQSSLHTTREATPMTVISEDHIISQPPILGRSQVLV
jgi:hypothetical protein